MSTEKLYWDDPFALTFETQGATLASWDGHPSLVLPATRFYPEAGGQLGDTGSLDLGGFRALVQDTQVTDDGLIHHVIDAVPPTENLTGPIHGEVDRERRLDHMAHHTAQHMLSSALASVARADTVSARLGRSSCTIDLDVPSTPEGELARVEDLVNAVVRDDVPVRAFVPTPEELSRLALRRSPKVSHAVRIVEILGFDQTPCGGTHCTRTGQVGVVRVVGAEKYKGRSRLTFVAAARALADMRARDQVLSTLTRELTCGATDLPAALGRIKAELRTSRESLGQTRAELARLVADEALSRHPASASGGDTRVLVLRDGDDVAALRLLAGRIATRSDAVAICVSVGEADDDCPIVVQRGAASSFDCGAWLRHVATAHGGRGGGRPERAEGRLPRAVVTSAELIAAGDDQRVALSGPE
jgi:alanyl-tRNA synthetase